MSILHDLLVVNH